MNKKLALTIGAVILSGSTMAQANAQASVKKMNESMDKPGLEKTKQYSKKEIMKVQSELKSRGFEIDIADGVMNKETTNAIRKFQANNNLNVDGQINQPTLQKLMSEKQTGYSE